MITKLRTAIANYPIPFFTLIGLIAGLIARFGFNSALFADRIWFFTLIICGIPIVWETIRGMFKGKFASDIVAMLAIITAVIMDQAFAGAVVVLMQSGGEALEKFGLRRATSSLDDLMARAPRIALLKKGEKFEEISVQRVRVGDMLIVRPGDLIPVDGTIVNGETSVDESTVTGEPLPKNKVPGCEVLSGCINLDGAIEMRADKISEESQYALIVELVRKAQEEKAPIERLADRYAIFFTPLTLFMAALGYFLTRDTTTILSVLVVATPCPLILATPVAVLSGINRAAYRGIIIKGGAAIEQVGKAESVIFDKTGTITYGMPYVEEVIPLNHYKSEELLLKAASIERFSSHTLAKAIVRKGLEVHKTLLEPTNFIEYPGLGVEAQLNGEKTFIGSERFVRQRLGDAALKTIAPVLSHVVGKTVTFISSGDKIVGLLTFTDKIRPNVPEMIRTLHKLGVKETALITGDCLENANYIARQAGITYIEAHLLPQQKVDIIKQFNQKYKVTIMVGDGINDAPALATATVGVAMGAHGSGITAEAADIVLLVDDVAKVSDAVAIGQRMLRIALQSIGVGIGLSFLLMVIAVFGYIQPAIGALLQEVIDAAVILNALRAR